MREHLLFTSRLFAEKIKNQRQRVEMKDFPYYAHVDAREEGIAVVLVTDNEYPERVAFGVLDKAHSIFGQSSDIKWADAHADTDLHTNPLTELLSKYQKPEEADSLLHLQTQLDEIKGILHNNIEQVIGMGDSLDKLIKESDDLSTMSKTFAKTAKRNNQCCKMW